MQHELEPRRFSAGRLLRFGGAMVILAVAAVIIGTMFALTGDPMALLFGVTKWFDPVFFQYSFLLFLFSLLFIPSITYFYTQRMKAEKLRRIRIEIPDAEWEASGGYIRRHVEETFDILKYIPSLLMVITLVAFGMSILLLLKPMPLALDDNDIRSGMDFGRGANFLMLGPFMDDFIHNKPTFISWMTISLTAFQFGFGGAFVYFLTHISRSYFTLDLRPDIFISSSIRMVIGSVLSIIISFAIVDIGENGPQIGFGGVKLLSIGWLPVFSFSIGYFPNRAMLWISKNMSTRFGFAEDSYRSIPLENMSGMSHSHEVRLREEGFDNVENLAQANCLDLAVRTGFSYRQLRAWTGEAWIRTHLRDDYDEFQKLTGIVDRDDLAAFLEPGDGSDGAAGKPDWNAILAPAADAKARLVAKAEIMSRLCRPARDGQGLALAGSGRPPGAPA